MGVKAGAYAGQDRFDCRSNLWADMESAVSFVNYSLLSLATLARVVHAVACQHLVITTETDNRSPSLTPLEIDKIFIY